VFAPSREPGPHIPDAYESELDVLRLFITDEVAEQFVTATNNYAESKKEEKKAMYLCFKRSVLTKEEIFRFIGVLLLLSINSVRNYRKAWEKKSSQVSIFLSMYTLTYIL
jgi:hypothetical protein